MRARKDPALEKTRKTFLGIPYFALNWVLKFISFFSYTLNLDLRWAGIPQDPFGSMMITNIGSLGLDVAYVPLVPYSRVPILIAMGAVKDVPVVAKGQIVPGKIMRGQRHVRSPVHRWLSRLRHVEGACGSGWSIPSSISTNYETHFNRCETNWFPLAVAAAMGAGGDGDISRAADRARPCRRGAPSSWRVARRRSRAAAERLAGGGARGRVGGRADEGARAQERAHRAGAASPRWIRGEAEARGAARRRRQAGAAR